MFKYNIIKGTNMNLEDFKKELDTCIVTFQYTKKDGSIRTAKGTRNTSYINSLIPSSDEDYIKFEKDVVDLLIELKGYSDLSEYTLNNGVEHVKTEQGFYYFKPIKRKKTSSPDVTTYFDIEKLESRSFKNENFIDVIDTCLIKEDYVE